MTSVCSFRQPVYGTNSCIAMARWIITQVVSTLTLTALYSESIREIAAPNTTPGTITFTTPKVSHPWNATVVFWREISRHGPLRGWSILNSSALDMETANVSSVHAAFEIRHVCHEPRIFRVRTGWSHTVAQSGGTYVLSRRVCPRSS